MKRLFATLSITLFTVMMLFSQAPDFAYPRKVEQKASRDLTAALASGNGDEVVNALVRIGLAQSLISSDSLPGVIARVEQVRAKETNAATRAMLSLLEADIYTGIYNSDRWTIARRGEVSLPEGENDYTLWGTAQFSRKVLGLISDALADPAALRAVPLAEYSKSIEYERDALTFYPTLLDFAAYRGIDYLTSAFLSSGRSLPMALLSRPTDTSLFPSATASPVEHSVLDIYRMLREGREETAAGMHAMAEAMGFIAPRVFTFERPVFEFSNDKADSDAGVQRIFLDTYLSHMRVPYAVELLLDIPSLTVSSAIAPQVYAALLDFEKNNPSYFNLSGVKRLIASLSDPVAGVTAPSIVAKGIPFTVKVSASNVNKLTLKLYKIDDKAVKRDASSYRGALPSESVATAEVEIRGTVPFRSDAAASFTANDYGRYVIVAEGDGLTAQSYNNIIDCSDLAVAAIMPSEGKKNDAVVLRNTDGAPVEGASVYFAPWDRRTAATRLTGTTSADGFLKFDVGKSGNIYPVLGNDRFADAISVYDNRSTMPEARLSGTFVTSLGLYKPGDTVDFAAVVYETSSKGVRPVAGRTFKVMMRDANYQEAGTVTLESDAWGRARGSFTLPEEGLTGQFYLQFADDDISGGETFMVSDYKLPTFEAQVTSTVRPATLGDAAAIEGTAMTFAGFPVEGAKVKAQLRVRIGAWWFATTSPVFYEAEAVTDAQGRFRLVVPGAVIAGSPCPQGYFTADIAVTSPDGETRPTNAGFNLGKPCYISSTISAIFSADNPAKTDVQLLDYDGKPSEAELLYKICKVSGDREEAVYSSYIVAEGTVKTGDFAPVLAALPSGTYGVIFDTADHELADPTRPAIVTVWRQNDKVCPADELLWLPTRSVVADGSGKASLTFGTNAPGNSVLMIVRDNRGGVAETRWIKAAGMQTVEVQVPAGCDSDFSVNLSTVHRCERASAAVTVSPASSRRRIEVKVSTFRDKVAPGSEEKLTIHVSGIDGASARSAVMLDMSNKAIDVIQSNPFSLSTDKWYGIMANIVYPDFGKRWLSLSGKRNDYGNVEIEVPEFRMYGRSFGFHNLRIRGGMKHAARTMAVNNDVSFDAVESVEEEAEEKLMDYGSPMGAPEIAMATAGGMGGEDEDAMEENPVKNNDTSTYRPSEVPLAFFRPMLTTDSLGNLDITYTVPDANTTWVLRSLAYNSELLTATDRVEIVASKPLMVSTNATRFLRCGDRVVLPASVMNATDSTIVATTVCELLSVTDKSLLASTERNDTIAAGGRAVASVEFDVPATVSGVIFRVRSMAGNFTDGEQAFIPVLPSEQNVVESTPFYIAPGENHFTMKLPQVKKGRAYLRYNGNPAWEVVSALPGLRDGKFTSSVEAAGALYSALVADGLMKQYPEIARTIRRWADNPADSALVSPLSRDNELKEMLLNSTPWVSDALSETERMQRLVLLFDGRNTRRVVASALAELKKTSASGGGWCWTTQYPVVSEWATAQVLDILGGLNRLGWLPDNKELRSMIESAVKYLDAEAAEDFRKYPKSDFTSYCYMRLKYPEIKASTAAKAVINVQVNSILSSWKSHGVVLKAADAQILHSNGYQATARTILESLSEYATYTPQKGMWWEQLSDRYSFWSMDKVGCTAIILDAYSMVSPKAPEVDRIRQWLVLNKTDNSWGNAIITSQVVSSVLLSGSDWTVLPEKTAVRVGDTLLEPKEEYATGAFTEQITPLLSESKTLTIDRQGNYPSFGGLLTMRVLPMEEVKAVKTDDLSVRKYLTVFDGAKWVPATSFKVGDRVKVVLTLVAGKDMSYVVLADKRAAALEPKVQLPTPVYSEGLCFYRENRDEQTNIFIDFLPKGTYVLEYELFASQAGEFASGVAQVQSQYNPVNTAHSEGARIVVK